MSLQNKVVWITGGSKGIGKAITDKLISKDAIVYNSSRTQNNNEKTINIKTDLSDSNQINSAFKKIISDEDKIDILINNAGIAHFKEFKDFTEEEFNEMNEINFKSVFTITQLALNKMLEQKSGIIINILSVAVNKTFTFSSVYAATKSAIKSMSNSIREEVRGKGIKIINIYPGATNTGIWFDRIRDQMGDVMSSPEDVADIIVSTIELAVKNPNTMTEEILLKPQNGDI